MRVERSALALFLALLVWSSLLAENRGREPIAPAVEFKSTRPDGLTAGRRRTQNSCLAIHNQHAERTFDPI